MSVSPRKCRDRWSRGNCCSKLAVCVADEDGDTPLHNAANGNHVIVTKLLLEAGGDVTAENGDGNTPAMLARDDPVVALFN
ncbi:hypothetical protein T484DRAFT_1773589 [Baffinella frigidus]|nr:hypothetical protein T484DRAFT_1773589 [Cryptophyta sp. CCMP2293]